MAFLKNKVSGAITDDLDPESVEFQKLVALRDAVNTTLTLWEEIGEQNVAGATSRVKTINNPGAAVGADETSDSGISRRGGTLTAVEYFPDADIVGADTNSRTLTVTQDDITGTSSPARTVTTRATLAFTNGVNATAKQSKAFTINSASFNNDEVLKVVSTHVGTGLADPGGLVVLTYTPA